jgi:hypothetical protein
LIVAEANGEPVLPLEDHLCTMRHLIWDDDNRAKRGEPRRLSAGGRRQRRAPEGRGCSCCRRGSTAWGSGACSVRWQRVYPASISTWIVLFGLAALASPGGSYVELGR